MFTVMHLQCNSMGQDSQQISSDFFLHFFP